MTPAANLSLLWQELAYLDRFEAAAKAGFTAVEVLFPYDLAADETRRACVANGLELILINAPPLNEISSARGFAAVPGRSEMFRRDMARAFDYAETLGARFVHVMAGEAAGQEGFETFVGNLAWAASVAPKGLILTIEPLNPVAMPGYFLNDYGLAERIIEQIAMPNLGLQYDSYHAQMIHCDAVDVFDRYRAHIVHAQIGDTPDRGAPGTGAVDFRALFARMKSAGYAGWVSGEYQPGPVTEESLGWMSML